LLPPAAVTVAPDPKPQLCFNCQYPECTKRASLQTANACRTSWTTNGELKNLQALLNIKNLLFIYMAQATAEKYLKNHHIALLW